MADLAIAVSWFIALFVVVTTSIDSTEGGKLWNSVILMVCLGVLLLISRQLATIQGVLRNQADRED